MRYALISDIHANAPALIAVQDDIAWQAEEYNQPIDAYWCLGDVIGYGPYASECVQFIQQSDKPLHWLVGNHDAGLVGIMSTQDFNQEARTVLARHRSILEQHGQWQWCQEHFATVHLPPQKEQHGDMCYVFTHACLVQNEYIGRSSSSYLRPWEPLLLEWNGFNYLRESYLGTSQRACMIFGHTHFPTFAKAERERKGVQLRSIRYNQALPLGDDLTAINPGSVGQPRDGDRRAAYAILDTDAHTVEFRRVAYDYTQTLTLMEDESYPERLCQLLINAGGSQDLDNLAQVYRKTSKGLEVVSRR